MKYLFLISILIFLMTSSVIAQEKFDCERDGLLGPVRTVEAGRIEYSLVEGKAALAERRLVTSQTSFNETCHRIETLSYGPKGEKLERRVYTYDPSGRNTGYLEFSSILDKSLATSRKHTYVLDGEGRIVEYLVFDSDGSTGSRFIYEYDAKGNKLEQRFYSWNGTRTGRLVSTYDAGGHPLIETSYDRNELPSWKSINSYDAQGRRSERTQFIGGILRYKFTFGYDDKGRLTSQETFEFNAPPNISVSHAPVPGKVTYAYNDSERTKEILTYSPIGDLKSKEIHTTDERGNEISWLRLDGSGSVKTHDISWYDKNRLSRTLSGKPSTQYEYDSHGNWTKKTYLIWAAGAKEPEAWNAEYRIISYY